MADGEASKPKKKRTAAQVAKILDRGTRILELRKTGASLRAISKALIDEAEKAGLETKGLSYSQVKRNYDEIVELRIDEQQDMVDEIRVLCLERLETVLVNYMPHMTKRIDALSSDNDVRMKLKAGDVVVKAVKEISELYGVKRPQKVEMSGLDGKPFHVVTAISIEPVASTIPRPTAPDIEEDAQTEQ